MATAMSNTKNIDDAIGLNSTGIGLGLNICIYICVCAWTDVHLRCGLSSVRARPVHAPAVESEVDEGVGGGVGHHLDPVIGRVAGKGHHQLLNLVLPCCRHRENLQQQPVFAHGVHWWVSVLRRASKLEKLGWAWSNISTL